MTDQEIIDVVKAHQNGKAIQYKGSDGFWHDTIAPLWDFRSIEYRVKPEPKYRPYKNAEELDEAIKEHGCYVKCKDTSARCMIDKYWDEMASLSDCSFLIYPTLYSNYTWLDGTPCGMME